MQQAAAGQARIAQSPRQLTAQLQAKALPEPAVLVPVNNTGLPDRLKVGVEQLSGYSLDDVQVHYNSAKPAQLQAHAYAQGTDIHVAPGQEQQLPHETWHVVQQKQGRVKPTRQLKGKVAVNDDAGLEKEADVMGDKALGIARNTSEATAQRKPQDTASQKTPARPTSAGLATSTIQRQVQVDLTIDRPDLKKISAQGTVEEFSGGTSAGKYGWVGVTKYRSHYSISDDDNHEDTGEVGPLKNEFTNAEAGHVLANQNGGDGTDAENVFAQDGGTNNSVYKVFENKMRKDLNKYEDDDQVEFIGYLGGTDIEEGLITDEGLSDASSIMSESDEN